LVINKCVTAVKVSNFSGHYLRNRSTLDIGVLGWNTLPKFCPFLLGHPVYIINYNCNAEVESGKGKGRAIPLQAWTGPEGSRRLGPPDFKTVGT